MRAGRADLSRAIVRTVHHAYRDDVFGLAAELSYRFFLALFPFFIFLAALGSLITDALPVRNPAERIVDSLGTALPADVADVLRSLLQHVMHTQPTGLLPLSVVATFWATASGFNCIFKALNRAYEVQETRPLWRRYLKGLGLTLLSGTLLLTAFVLAVSGQVFGRQLLDAAGAGGAWDSVLVAGRWLVTVLALVGGTTLLYRAAPNTRVSLPRTLPGTLLFAAGWTGGTFLFAFYLSDVATYDATYGTLGGAAILLIWFYFTSMVLLLGGELNAAIDTHPDREPDTAQRALPVTETAPLEAVLPAGPAERALPEQSAPEPLQTVPAMTPRGRFIAGVAAIAALRGAIAAWLVSARRGSHQH
jgi:membrane protein